MTGAEIITAFEQQVDDLTELSSTEELALLNKVYKKVMRDRPWEITKKAGTGTQSSSVAYVSLPADFAFITQNHGYTQTTMYTDSPCVFVGTNYQPYKIVSWSDRRQYRDQDGYAYVDIANSRLYFTKQPATAQSYEFDYHSVPDDLTTATSPVFPADFHHMLAHLMATEDFIMQLSDKAKSYAPENKAMAKSYMDDMTYWNARLVQLS